MRKKSMVMTVNVPYQDFYKKKNKNKNNAFEVRIKYFYPFPSVRFLSICGDT